MIAQIGRDAFLLCQACQQRAPAWQAGCCRETRPHEGDTVARPDLVDEHKGDRKIVKVIEHRSQYMSAVQGRAINDEESHLVCTGTTSARDRTLTLLVEVKSRATIFPQREGSDCESETTVG